MGFLDKIRSLFTGAASAGPADPHGIWLHFRCDKCGAVVRMRADRRNDLNREDGPGTFLLRKEVMDDSCFQLMNAEIWLDTNYNVVTAEVSGGQLISEEEYRASREK